MINFTSARTSTATQLTGLLIPRGKNSAIDSKCLTIRYANLACPAPISTM